MASKPTDLTNKTWQKLKAKTLGKTGFGDKLDAYQTALAKIHNFQTRNVAAFGTAADALHDIIKAIPEAQKKCNKTLHKETIELLAAYKPLAEKEGGELHNAAVKYQGYVDEFKNLRVVCAKEQAILEKQMTAEAKHLEQDVKGLLDDSKIREAAQAAKSGADKLQKIQDLADASLAKPRVSKAAEFTPHADDRPDASVFTALIDKQKEIIAIRNDAVGKVTDLIKDAMSKATAK